MRAKKDFQLLKNDSIYIPDIHHEYTSSRVLVMEWIDGIKVTNTDELIKKFIFKISGHNIKNVL
jgi:predicted unusual protein kinase regulating ubiquinone biosynthesis (AarF/ABC1/UbiB family)